jgi:hypothetical protein
LLIDGILTALHGHGDALGAEEIGRRLAERMDLPAEEIAQMLVSNDRAVLGICRQLIGLRTSGVQCHPEDLRLARFQLEIVRNAQSWSLRGAIACC